MSFIMFFLIRIIGFVYGEFDFLIIICVFICWMILCFLLVELVGYVLEVVWWVLNYLCLFCVVLKLLILDLYYFLKMLFGIYKEDLKFLGFYLKLFFELLCNINLINN